MAIPPIPDYLILFDGECNFCDKTVQFVLRHDKQNKFYFASLNTALGKHLVQSSPFPAGKTDSIIYVRKGIFYAYSDAVLKILADLGGMFTWLSIFIVIPAFIRNAIYRWFASIRYKIFGTKTVCHIPSPEQRKRFLY